MMKKAFAFVAVVLFFGWILAACAKPPVEEMNNAQDAVTRAENDSDAVSYAGNTLVRARDALVRMQEEAGAKRYDEAKKFAAEAVILADRAIVDGKAGAGRARDEAAALVNGLTVPLAETADALDVARADGGLDLDFDALSGDLDMARRTYDEARQSLQVANYRDAADKGQNVRSLLTDINMKINNAARTVSRKK